MGRRVLLCLVGFACLAFPTAATAAPVPFVTALIDTKELSGPEADLAFERVHDAGVTAIRTTMSWYAIAPRERPPAFAAANWRDPAYDWSGFDEKLRRLRAEGLEPIVAVNSTPVWARRDVKDDASPPRAKDIAAFMRAAADRYDGRTAGVPRVKYWQIWIEPNVNFWFSPQFSGKRAVSPELYRSILNAAADALHAVRRDNVVIAGGLSPFTVNIENSLVTVAPLQFMRELLCLSRGAKPRPTCKQHARFDIWSHHPYTSGGPTHEAYRADDVSLGDLPEMRRLLDAGVRLKKVRSKQRVRFWVTEFSWDTSPPDPKGVPARLHARWTAEALYRMWQSGVELVTWLQLRDEPYPESSYQAGLYFRRATFAKDKPKPALAAFRFPFVAFREREGLVVWGRTPTSKAARVFIERKPRGGPWRRVATLRADGYGVFNATLSVKTSRRDYVRARQAGGRRAVPFSLTRPPDRAVRPFG